MLAIRALHEKYGHIQEVIVQNFRAKPEIPMANHPEPSLDDMLRTVAIARLILGPHMNLQAPPNLSYADFPRLLEAGINDWGGISPVTKDFINPEAAWPQIEKLRIETEARGFTLRERLALYPEFVDRQANSLSASRVRATPRDSHSRLRLTAFAALSDRKAKLRTQKSRLLPAASAPRNFSSASTTFSPIPPRSPRS